MTDTLVSSSFFVSGGTVPLRAESYVVREADQTLLKALLAGKYCYVLNARQMGKSSLCVRTMAKLQDAGWRTAFVDLTRIGGQNLTPEQWYAGLLGEISRALDLRGPAMAYWKERPEIGPLQRLFGALRDVCLAASEAPLAVFIDEIDATRSLPFSTDEFYAAVRECYNRRAQDPAYQRLSFCMLGVAVPSDLISNPDSTPFNIGERTVLQDFSLEEARQLALGLGPNGEALLERIFYWTNGHPFLTQSVCAVAAEDPTVVSAAEIDRIVARLLLEPKARETNINLADVSNRVLKVWDRHVQASRLQADVLNLYKRVLAHKYVSDDESNRLATALKLSGIVRVESGRLVVRNRIYERAFDRTWVRENMPGAELQRQRKAFLNGVLRTAGIAGVAVVLTSWLAVNNAHLVTITRTQADRYGRQAYIATMNLMPSVWEEHNLDRLNRLLASEELNSSRGWEWSYWHRLSNLSLASQSLGMNSSAIALSPDGSTVATNTHTALCFFDSKTGRFLRQVPTPTSTINNLRWITPTRLLELDSEKNAYIVDSADGLPLDKIPDLGFRRGRCTTTDGHYLLGERSGSRLVVYDLWKRKIEASVPVPVSRSATEFSPDGLMIVAAESSGVSEGPSNVVVRRFGSWAPLSSFRPSDYPTVNSFSPDEQFIAVGTQKGAVEYWSIGSHLQRWTTPAMAGPVRRIQFSRDGGWMAVCGDDRVARLYEITDHDCRLIGEFPDADQMLLSPDKSRLVTRYRELRVYDPANYVEVPTYAFPAKSYGQWLGIEKNGDAWLVDNRSEAFRLSTKDKAPSADRFPLDGAPAGFCADRPWVLLDRAGNEQIFDLENTKTLCEWQGAGAIGSGIAASTDGRKALVWEGGSEAVLWNIPNRTVIASIKLPHFVRSGAFAPNGSVIVVGDASGGVTEIDSSTGNVISQKQAHEATVNSVRFSDDGAGFVTSSNDDSAIEWDAKRFVPHATLTGHSQDVLDASFSPDGTRIVTGSADQTVRIWDAVTGDLLTSLKGHHAMVRRVRFLPDSSAIVSIDASGAVKTWLRGS